MANTGPDLRKVHGDRCTFCMFRFFNFFLSFVGVGVFVLGIYLWALVKVFTVFSGLFFVLGICAILTSLWGWKSRYSTASLVLYLIFLTLVWIAQIIGSIMLFVSTDKVVEWAHEHDKNHESIEHIKEDFSTHLDIIKYCALAGGIIEMFCLIFGYYYRRSIFSKKERLLIDNNAQSLLNMDQSTPVTDAKRAEMMDKYPDLAKKYSRTESEASSTTSSKKKRGAINL